MCYNPVILESRDYQPVPCGKCPECKMRIVHGWAFRLMQEEKRSISSLFTTLTYDEKMVPISQHGRLSLWKRDCQLFFKRLRKENSKSDAMATIKYFLCGEYGGQTKRPHYHALIFNADVRNIETSWKFGSVHYGTVNDASVYYTLKYMMKTPPKRKRDDDREPEFRIMSKGIGLGYTQKTAVQKWHKADLENRMYLNLTDGKKIGMPRYYKDKLYSEEEREDCAYAGLLKARQLAEKDQLNPQQKHERILASYLNMEFQNRLRNKI